MSEWHGKLTYISVKFVKFLIKSKEELTLYISLIRLHIYTNIMKLVLLREIVITNNLKNVLTNFAMRSS